MTTLISFPSVPPAMETYGRQTAVSEDFWEIPLDIPWGDIVPPSEDTGPVGIGWSCESSPEKDALDGWSAPSLRLRKNIWENFPVSLVPLNEGDGTDRYAIVWHQRNLTQWREEKSESYVEWMDYQWFCLIRLMHALNLNANRYIVEEARDDEQICIIAMVHDGDTVASDPIAPLALGCDLLAHEATFMKGMEAKCRVAQHSTAWLAGDFAQCVQARQLVLTHFSASYSRVGEEKTGRGEGEG